MSQLETPPDQHGIWVPCTIVVTEQSDSDSRTKRPTIRLPSQSFRTVALEMMFCPNGVHTGPDDPRTPMSIGTGFFYRMNGTDYLITARHNLSGQHWETSEYLYTAHNVGPTHIRVAFRHLPPQGGYTSEGLRMSLYLLPLLDESNQPLWLEHPDHKSDMDVVALPVTNPRPGMIAIHAWEHDETDPSHPLAKLWGRTGHLNHRVPVWPRERSQTSALDTRNNRVRTRIHVSTQGSSSAHVPH